MLYFAKSSKKNMARSWAEKIPPPNDHPFKQLYPLISKYFINVDG